MGNVELGFVAWPKTKRQFRDIVVTEKIDGTNAAITFAPNTDPFIQAGDKGWILEVQSRSRLITPGKGTDNYGFARWAYDNADELFKVLGYGRHFGEWWGKGIARHYGMDHRVFSIFNTEMWQVAPYEVRLQKKIGDAFITHTPVLYKGVFSEDAIMDAAAHLTSRSSVAAANFGKVFRPTEGICIYHTETKIVTKFTFDNNDRSKWEEIQ